MEECLGRHFHKQHWVSRVWILANTEILDNVRVPQSAQYTKFLTESFGNHITFEDRMIKFGSTGEVTYTLFCMHRCLVLHLCRVQLLVEIYQN